MREFASVVGRLRPQRKRRVGATVDAETGEEITFTTMHFLRRVVTILMSLGILQLTLAPSSVACVGLMADAAQTGHASHAAHAAAPHAADAAHDVDVPAPDAPHDTGCHIPVCASSPVLLSMTSLPADAPEPAVRVAPSLDATPASHLQALDPPPPRA